MNRLSIVVATVAVFGGCHQAAVDAVQRDDVSLGEFGATVNSPSGQVHVEAPLGMGIDKRVALTSRCTSDLNALTVATSCGCSFAVLSDTVVRPGEQITLRMSFRPERAPVQRAVRALLRHGARPDDAYEIGVTYSATATLDAWKVVAMPPAVSVDGPWSPGYSRTWHVDLELGDSVVLGSLSASCSSPSVHPVLRNGTSPHRAILEIGLADPPAGPTREEVRVSVPRGRETYFAAILLTGELLAPFYCDPVEAAVSGEKATGRASATIHVIRRQAMLGSPRVTVTGNWAIEKLPRVAEDRWDVSVVSRGGGPMGVDYGLLRVGGDWNGQDVIVPLTATTAR